MREQAAAVRRLVLPDGSPAPKGSQTSVITPRKMAIDAIPEGWSARGGKGEGSASREASFGSGGTGPSPFKRKTTATRGKLDGLTAIANNKNL